MLIGSAMRSVLEGVPRIHFYEGGSRCPEDIILPSAIRSVLEYINEKEYGCKHTPATGPGCRIPCTYAFLVGVSGAASFLSWKEGWHRDNTSILSMLKGAETPERHIFEAIGYEFEWLTREEGRDNERMFRERIAESIERGMPVLAYGVVGPPEASIVAGFDDGGDVLIGWSFFQCMPEFGADLQFEPSGYFRKRNWFASTQALLIIGRKKNKPPLEETCRTALKLMLQVSRPPMVWIESDAPEWRRERHNGLAAYDAWMAHLLRDEEWPAYDEPTLRSHHQVHDDAVGALAEARWYGSVFLAQSAEVFAASSHRPGASADILHAAACYAAEHDLMWEVWKLAGGIGNPEACRIMTSSPVRRAVAEIIRKARGQEVEAAGHIERALLSPG